MTHILIAEDEKRIAAFLVKGFATAGFRTTVASTGGAALQAALTAGADLMILDIGLPGIDGLTVLRSLRAQGSSLPVVILTANDSTTVTVAGLDGGADDHMTKPFAFAELLARVRRRLAASAASRVTPAAGPDWLAVDGLDLDLLSRQACVAGTWVELSAREVALLRVLLTHPDRALARDELLRQAWGSEHDPGTNLVDVYVGYLRRKLGARRIETVRGQGYRLRSHLPAGPAGQATAR
ncbi:MAG: response regulator transcription factor [Candidatus Nanopelagicales bacterium]